MDRFRVGFAEGPLEVRRTWKSGREQAEGWETIQMDRFWVGFAEGPLEVPRTCKSGRTGLRVGNHANG